MRAKLPFRVAAALVWLISAFAAGVAAEDADAPAKQFTCIDLQGKATRKLVDRMHGFPGNDLIEIPRGEQAFNEVKFKIEDGFLGLGGRLEPQMAAKIDGIAIGKSAVKLHILHGTYFGSYGKPGGSMFVADGSAIGEYLVHYEDSTTESIPIVYGDDVRDWWNWDKPATVKRGTIAWTGQNEFSRQQEQNIYLYLTSWVNPHPEKKIITIDYSCNRETAASPFCVGITVEAKPGAEEQALRQDDAAAQRKIVTEAARKMAKFRRAFGIIDANPDSAGVDLSLPQDSLPPEGSAQVLRNYLELKTAYIQSRNVLKSVVEGPIGTRGDEIGDVHPAK